MPVETLMYFALGFLIASVLALMVLPQVWRRAVRRSLAKQFGG